PAARIEAHRERDEDRHEPQGVDDDEEDDQCIDDAVHDRTPELPRPVLPMLAGFGKRPALWGIIRAPRTKPRRRRAVKGVGPAPDSYDVPGIESRRQSFLPERPPVPRLSPAPEARVRG